MALPRDGGRGPGQQLKLPPLLRGAPRRASAPVRAARCHCRRRQRARSTTARGSPRSPHEPLPSRHATPCPPPLARAGTRGGAGQEPIFHFTCPYWTWGDPEASPIPAPPRPIPAPPQPTTRHPPTNARDCAQGAGGAGRGAGLEAAGGGSGGA